MGSEHTHIHTHTHTHTHTDRVTFSLRLGSLCGCAVGQHSLETEATVSAVCWEQFIVTVTCWLLNVLQV